MGVAFMLAIVVPFRKRYDTRSFGLGQLLQDPVLPGTPKGRDGT
jgi:hypothetical protein